MLGEVLTATVTPFDADGAVDYDALPASSARSSSTTAPTASSSTARPARRSTLSEDERTGLIRAALEAIGDRATVVAGTGTNSTEHSIHLTEQAQEAGAHAVLVVTPYYNKPPQRGIVAHFKAVAAATDLPVVAYNIPGRCVINIEPETMAELAEIQNVKAVKQSNADLDQARRIVELGLDLYAGDDNLVLPFVELGGLGRRLRPHPRRRAAGEGDDPALPRGRRRGGAAARRRARGRLRADRRRHRARSRSRPR